MATNVKFSTGLEEDLLKLNSDKTYVNKIDNGHIYFTTRTNDEGEVIGSIFYDVDDKRVSMGGGIAEQAKADDMKQNIADTYVTRISSEGTKYASTDGVTITTYNGRNVALDTIMLPVASANRAGTVIAGAQTFAGNKTFNNNILFPNVSTGISSGIRWTVGDSDGARIITGATASDAGYLEIAVKSDGNEPIYVRQYSGDFATLVRTLTLLDASGNTIIPGSLLPTAKDTKDLGSETYRWNNAYIKNVQADTLSGHLTGSLTGNVTGNVTGHASLDLPLAGGTMTGDITFKAIASWPAASGETYPIKSKGLKWSGSSDTAAIYYQVDGADSGHLYISMGDDDAASVKFAKSGIAHTIFDSAGKLYPVTNDTGYIGTSSNKFKAIYATNFYGIIEKAYQDESGNNIKATYAATLKNHAHDGNGWSFRLLNKNGAALADALTIPGATAEKAGLITTGAQTFAGKKTFNGQVVIANTTDAAKATANSGALIVGNPSGEHLAIDGNEIMAKASGTTVRALLFQLDGGETKFGGSVLPYTTDTHSLGTEALAWKEAHIGEIYGHLTGSLTGNVTGNATSASKLLTARKIILGNDLQGSVSFDGTKDVTISAASYSASIGGGNKANYPWHRIATTGANAVTSIYNDKDIVIVIRHSYNNGGYGIAKVSMRTNNASGGATANCTITWLVRYNIAEDALQAGFRNTAADSYADLFYKCNTYPRATVYQLQGNRAWTLISSTEASDTTTTDKKTSSEAYATIAAAATELGRTYTHTIVAEDGGIIGKAYMDESGNNIKASYLASIQQVTSDKDTFTFRGYNKNNAAMNNLIIIPAATASGTDQTKWKAGLVTSQAQTWAGDKTFTGNIIIAHTASTDMTASSTNPKITFSEGGTHQPVHLIYTDYDGYRSPAGLKVIGGTSATPAWFEVEGALFVGGASTLNGNVSIKGNIMPQVDNTYVIGDLNAKWKDIYSTTAHVYNTLYVNTSTTGTVGGIALHGTVDPTAYGIAMRSNLGAHGYATDTWNTYFMMSNGATRGWVFRNGTTNVASINGQGYISANKLNLNRTGGIANGRISWYSTTYKTWHDYMSNVVAGGCPSGGTPSILGAVKTWALRSYIENASGHGWLWESAAESNTGTPTPRMALSSNTGKLYLSNDLNIITGDTDKFVHYLYDGTEANTIGASWRAGVKQSTTDNEYVIESGSAATTATAWLNGLKITQATLNATFGTSALGGLGIANTSATTGHGISLYSGGMSGKPTYGLMFAGTATFKTHGYVTGDWATYFTMNGTANRGWIFLKDANPVASISNDGKANFGETYIRGPLKIGDNANGDTNYIAFYGTTGDNPGSFNHAYIGENLWGTNERSELLIFKGNDIGTTATGPDRIRHVAAAHLFQVYTTALSGTWTTICDSTVPVSVFEINQSGIVVTGATTISGNATVGGTLDVTGNTSLGAELSVTSYAKFKQGSAATGLNTGAVQVTGGISVSAASYIGGALTVNSTINATGNVTAPRFIGLADRATLIDATLSGTSSATHLTAHPATAGRVAFYYNVNPCTGLFTTDNNANFLITLNKHSGNYDSQLGFSSDGNIYYRSFNGSALDTTTGWQMLLTTANVTGELDGRYVNVTGDTMSGALKVPNITISSTSSIAHIQFSCTTSYNYLHVPSTEGKIAFCAADSLSLKGSALVVTNTGIVPGNNNTFTLGSSSAYWSRAHLGALTMYGNITYANGSYTDYEMIKFVTGTGDGCGIVIGGGGLAVFGSGESASNFVSAAGLAGNTETTYITSDNGIYFVTNCQTIADRNESIFVSGGQISRPGTSTSWYLGRSNALLKITSYLGYNAIYSMKTTNGDWSCGVYSSNTLYWSYVTDTNFNAGTNETTAQMRLTADGYLYATRVYNAVWNDYAECRSADTEEPGRVVIEGKFGIMTKSTKRLQAGGSIISDTYGTSMGETDNCKTPVAVAGRVLAYPYEDRYSYPLGAAVCTGPNGTVSLMTREEIREYPERILGTVSEIPEYEVWGSGNVKVNGRIWIKVK